MVTPQVRHLPRASRSRLESAAIMKVSVLKSRPPERPEGVLVSSAGGMIQGVKGSLYKHEGGPKFRTAAPM